MANIFRILENTPCQGYFDVCCNASKEVLFPPTEAPEKNYGCGYQNSGFFPWYAALFYQELTEVPPSYKCGVSLIHSSVILTAAHCFNGNGTWSTRIGKRMNIIFLKFMSLFLSLIGISIFKEI